MTPDEFAALMAQHATKKEDVSSETWESIQKAQRYTREKEEKGEVLESWSKEAFPLGLNENLEPFTTSTSPDQEDLAGKGENQHQPPTGS